MVEDTQVNLTRLGRIVSEQDQLADIADGIPVTQFTRLIPAPVLIRPNNSTAYAMGALLANSVTPGLVVPLTFAVARVEAGAGSIRRVRVRKSGVSIVNAQLRLHLYNLQPTPVNGDNGAWLTNRAAAYMGAFDITFDRVFSDGAAGNAVPLVGNELNYQLPSGLLIWGLAEWRAAYAPIALEQYTFNLEVYQD